MLYLLIFAIIAILLLLTTYYVFHLTFYYKDKNADPHEYSIDDQIAKVKGLLDNLITEFQSAPYETVSITSHDGLTLHGRYYHVTDGAPLQIMLHGYKGSSIRDFCGTWQIAREAKHNVLLVDQRSHGMSEGHTITFGILERKDCLTWIQYAQKRFGSVPILLMGVSMGAATVLMASGMELPSNVKGIIADCPYDSPRNIIRKVLKHDLKLPVNLIYPLVRLGGFLFGKFNLEAYSPTEAVKHSKTPILLIHGDDDRFVPYEMSCNIYNTTKDKIEFYAIHDSGHAINYLTDPQQYSNIVLSFIKKHI